MSRVKVAGQLGAVALVLALLGLLVWKIASDDEPVKVGQVAPAIDLPELDGTGRVKTATFRGRAVVVNFWASWCFPCREEAPILEAAWRAYRDRGVVFLGVDTRDLISDARSFVQRYDVTYANGYDGPGKLANAYGLTGFPETFVIDREGRVVEHIVGPVEDAEELATAIEEALA